MDAQDINPYPLGHADRDLERLATQARDVAAHTTVLFRRAGLSSGHRVLDIGCGPGDVSFIAADIVGAIGVAICLLHNLLDGVPMPQPPVWGTIWAILHVQTPTAIGYVQYPLIPWVGVMTAGYALGRVFDLEATRRHRVLTALGASAIALFLALRLINTYGDPVPWSTQFDFGSTMMSFLNVAKYPPSLDYLLVTLGPALIGLACLENARGVLANVLQTYGRVPLFFYVAHIALAHLAAGLTAMAMGFGNGVLNNFFFNFPKEWGVSLPAVYVAWACVVIALYPACRWFADLKRRRGEWWLSYLQGESEELL